MNRTTDMMIVDDNVRARRALSSYLSLQPGLRVVAQASNGLEALRLMPSHNPDIVLMDVHMPVMDGLEATRAIKAKWPRVKIVVLTIYPDCQANGIASGADAFLVKGCSSEELLSTIMGVVAAGNKTGPLC